LLLLLALAIRDREVPVVRPAVPAAQRGLATLLVAAVPVQLALGGLVAATSAGLACATFPSCNGGAWFPTFEGLLGLQVAHRAVAWTLLGLAIANLAVARGRTVRPAALALAAVTFQGAVGVANVLLRLPVEVTLLHTAGAAAVVWSSVALAREVWVAPLHAELAHPAVAK
jgi:cytochrome c oxidase assembly protein subunit 15